MSSRIQLHPRLLLNMPPPAFLANLRTLNHSKLFIASSYVPVRFPKTLQRETPKLNRIGHLKGLAAINTEALKMVRYENAYRLRADSVLGFLSVALGCESGVGAFGECTGGIGQATGNNGFVSLGAEEGMPMGDFDRPSRAIARMAGRGRLASSRSFSAISAHDANVTFLARDGFLKSEITGRLAMIPSAHTQTSDPDGLGRGVVDGSELETGRTCLGAVQGGGSETMRAEGEIRRGRAMIGVRGPGSQGEGGSKEQSDAVEHCEKVCGWL
ncbi:hypothetical protein F5Y15DRAFT_375815 [Xylariaceae sp. FL0016]|nr:hypothetical protein F5Y15DRAFT_375815 [Xylariaceae sp. FL0016]